SRANFYTLRVREKGEAFFSFLWERGVVVRRLTEFFGLGEEFFRIAVRTREENELFLREVGTFAGTL
ncbi:MAG: aminotransferase class I/II-fold pyridoxal phosphate-dependent enzyme, partial [Candidatus Caldatribacteriaceae bacterium]